MSLINKNQLFDQGLLNFNKKVGSKRKSSGISIDAYIKPSKFESEDKSDSNIKELQNILQIESNDIKDLLSHSIFVIHSLKSQNSILQSRVSTLHEETVRLNGQIAKLCYAKFENDKKNMKENLFKSSDKNIITENIDARLNISSSQKCAASNPIIFNRIASLSKDSFFKKSCESAFRTNRK